MTRRGLGQSLDRFVFGTVELHRLLSVALIAAAPLVGFSLSRVQSWFWVAGLLLIQIAVAVSAWLVGEARVAKLEEARIAGRRESLVAIAYGLDPLLFDLGRTELQSAGERRAARSGLVRTIINFASGLSEESDEFRACYFRLVEDGSRALRFEESAGRAEQPKAEFRAGTVAGDAALAMVDAGESLLCDDIRHSPPAGWQGRENGRYESFVSVSVRAGDRAYGMLTLDAVQPGSLTAEDAKMMKVLGLSLGLVEAMTA